MKKSNLKLKVGDVVYPKGCSRDYQLQNPITINHVKEHTDDTMIDGKYETLRWMSASENGWSWYPFMTLTKRLSTNEVLPL